MMGVPSEELLAFLGQPVPRQLTRPIWKAARDTVGFGYIPTLLFLAFSSFFMYIFFPWHLEEIVLDLGTPSIAYGHVTSVHERSAKYNGSTIYDTYYEFKLENSGIQKGWSCAKNTKPSLGSKVKVEYVQSLPIINRVHGASHNPFGYFSAFVIIFFAFPVWGLWHIFSSRREKYFLLESGVLGAGQVSEVKATNVTMNNARRFKITVSYETPQGPQQSSYNAYRDDVTLARRKKATNTPVGILYDQNKPTRILIVDTLMNPEEIPMNEDAANPAETEEDDLYDYSD